MSPFPLPGMIPSQIAVHSVLLSDLYLDTTFSEEYGMTTSSDTATSW